MQGNGNFCFEKLFLLFRSGHIVIASKLMSSVKY
jgi:hypothetical protein